MKCFECNAICVTDYIKQDYDTDKIIAVQKVCPVCGWRSYPTKLPEPIR